jgi:peptidoglycan/LPS O-acetylase OafA/YrhL
MHKVHRFAVLDSFRGLCAACLVFFHIQLVSGFTESLFIRNADLLVNFFFVLSGFVLAYAYGSREHLNLRGFLVARSFRLVPLHWFMLGVFVLLEIAKLLAGRWGVGLNHPAFSGPFAFQQFVPNLLLIQAWAPHAWPMSFNYPSWSISVEFYIYLLFAAIMLLGARFLMWAGVALVAGLLLILQVPVLNERALTGLACFFAGCVTYRAFVYCRGRGQVSVALMTVFELLALAAVVLVGSTRFAEQSLVASVVFCAVVLLFAFEGGYVSVLLRARLFAWLGRLSYSIYMTHAAVLFGLTAGFILLEKRTGLQLTSMFEARRYLDTGSALGNSLLALGFLGVVVLVSVFTYRYVEQPGQALGRRLAGASAAPRGNLDATGLP